MSINEGISAAALILRPSSPSGTSVFIERGGLRLVYCSRVIGVSANCVRMMLSVRNVLRDRASSGSCACP